MKDTVKVETVVPHLGEIKTLQKSLTKMHFLCATHPPAIGSMKNKKKVILFKK